MREEEFAYHCRMREGKGSQTEWRRNALRSESVYPPFRSHHFKNKTGNKLYVTRQRGIEVQNLLAMERSMYNSGLLKSVTDNTVSQKTSQKLSSHCF